MGRCPVAKKRSFLDGKTLSIPKKMPNSTLLTALFCSLLFLYSPILPLNLFSYCISSPISQFYLLIYFPSISRCFSSPLFASFYNILSINLFLYCISSPICLIYFVSYSFPLFVSFYNILSINLFSYCLP